MKLHIAVPSYGPWQPEFGHSLALVMADLAHHEDLESVRLARCESTIIAAGRSDLVKDAIEHGADAILWCDTDIRFRPTNVRQLLSRNVDIVACDYLKRLPPHVPTAVALDGKAIEQSGTELIEAQQVGLGLALTKTAVFKRLPEPWFAFPWLEAKSAFMGEDVFFCHAAKAHDFKVYVDPIASIGVGHVGTQVFEAGPWH